MTASAGLHHNKDAVTHRRISRRSDMTSQTFSVRSTAADRKMTSANQCSSPAADILRNGVTLISPRRSVSHWNMTCFVYRNSNIVHIFASNKSSFCDEVDRIGG